LLPLVISPGAGSELYRGLGSVTLGGLVFSTFFTLFFIPALFTICMDAQVGLGRLFGREPQPALATTNGPTTSGPAPMDADDRARAASLAPVAATVETTIDTPALPIHAARLRSANGDHANGSGNGDGHGDAGGSDATGGKPDDEAAPTDSR